MRYLLQQIGGFGGIGALSQKLGVVGLLVLAGGCGGCVSMKDLDARTDALIRERSASLLGATISPVDGGDGVEGRSKTDTGLGRYGEVPSGEVDARLVPPTNDPPASSLRVSVADEGADVASRLDSYGVVASDARALSLTDVLRISQRSGREYLNAQDAYLIAAINLLLERHLWGPRFFATTSGQVTATGEDGDFDAPLRLINELRATQRLTSGGEVEARFVWDATEQLRDVATDRYVQSSALVLSGNVPLLRGAGISAREDLIQAERNLVYAARTFERFRRTFLVDIAGDYFDLLQQQGSIENQSRALELLRRLETRTAALVESGRLAEFQKNIAASDVLRARQQLSNQRERFILAMDRFKIRLGLDVTDAIVLKAEVPELPRPDVTPEQAGKIALEYRLDLQTQRDQVEDAKRGVEIAQNNTLASVNAFGSATLRTKPAAREGGAVYETDDAVYNAGVRVDWPLDRTQEQLGVRRSQIDAQRAGREFDQLRDNVILQARASVRELDRAKFNLDLAERSVQINLRRAKEQEIKADEVTAQDVVDTANALRDAENARDQAVTDLRNAILSYLDTTGQLRVDRSGLLLRPGSVEDVDGGSAGR